MPGVKTKHPGLLPGGDPAERMISQGTVVDKADMTQSQPSFRSTPRLNEAEHVEPNLPDPVPLCSAVSGWKTAREETPHARRWSCWSRGVGAVTAVPESIARVLGCSNRGPSHEQIGCIPDFL